MGWDHYYLLTCSISCKELDNVGNSIFCFFKCLSISFSRTIWQASTIRDRLAPTWSKLSHALFVLSYFAFLIFSIENSFYHFYFVLWFVHFNKFAVNCNSSDLQLAIALQQQEFEQQQPQRHATQQQPSSNGSSRLITGPQVSWALVTLLKPSEADCLDLSLISSVYTWAGL